MGKVKESLTVFDQKVGVEIVMKALKVPCRTIAMNAGAEGSVVVEKLLNEGTGNLGYNAATGEYVDMVKTGIIDPAKVVRTALVDAASVASLMMTSECLIVTADDKAADLGGGGGGGGMGMGGMY